MMPPSTKRIDLKTGFSCNNRCVFCVQGDKRRKHEDKSTSELKAILADARASSDSVVFTGGEVTIREDLAELVNEARDLGFRCIQIQTNGRMLSYAGFTRRLVEAGATEFSPALHGHTASLHDELTSAEGSFKQTVSGIRNLKTLGARVIVNVVVVKQNLEHLPAIASLLVRLDVDQYQFAFVHALGTAARNFDRVVPRFPRLEPFLKAALDIGIRAGKPVMTEAVPYCFMRDYEQYVAERVIPRTKIYDADSVLDDYTEYRLNEGKAKGPACNACAVDAHCEGPWREYPERFGWDEFRPLSEREARGVRALLAPA